MIITGRGPGEQASLVRAVGGILGTQSRKPKIWTAVDRAYETLRIGMQTLFHHAGIETVTASA
jgi:hypothetical protein